MHRTAAVVGVAVGIGVVLAAPGAAGAQTAAQDSVEGTALACRQPPSGCLSLPPGQFGEFVQLTAEARSGPSGENPMGRMTWGERFVGGFALSDTAVTCLSARDNVAIIGVSGTRRFTIIAGSIDVSIAGLVRITDGGSGLDTLEFAVDQGPFVPPPPPPLPAPTECSAFPGGSLDTADDEGDLVVTDARPLPTSKDQCKNGRWQSYGVFKSQGDCVSFVGTKGRSQPSGP